MRQRSRVLPNYVMFIRLCRERETDKKERKILTVLGTRLCRVALITFQFFALLDHILPTITERKIPSGGASTTPAHAQSCRPLELRVQPPHSLSLVSLFLLGGS